LRPIPVAALVLKLCSQLVTFAQRSVQLRERSARD
jgi:hypothetical protein